MIAPLKQKPSFSRIYIGSQISISDENLMRRTSLLAGGKPILGKQPRQSRMPSHK